MQSVETNPINSFFFFIVKNSCLLFLIYRIPLAQIEPHGNGYLSSGNTVKRGFIGNRTLRVAISKSVGRTEVNLEGSQWLG